MTEEEFLLLDHLYFVVSYHDLLEEKIMGENQLKKTLLNMINKGWVNCFSDPESEVETTHVNFAANYSKYYYLASKQGMLEHNQE